MMLGAVSSGNQMPFWEYSNQFDLMPRTPGFTTVLDGELHSDPSRAFQYCCGTTLALRCDAFDWASFVPGQAYAGIEWKVLSLDLGLRNPDLLYLGADPAMGSLSSTSGNLVMSGNARNMPGYTLTLDPWSFPYTRDHFQLFAKFGDYFMTDSRVEGRLMTHNTLLGAQLNFWGFSLGFCLDHWAQWDGRGFGNYLRVITGSHGGSGASKEDRVNIPGNQLGAEKFFLRYRGTGWTAEIRHDIPYEDKSGMRFGNFPDGMNYLMFSFDDKDRWVSDIVFEYDYTMYQSGPIHEDEFDEDGNHIPWTPGRNYFGLDNYFNNGQLTSAWTHYGMTIGTPLFYPAGTRNCTWDRQGPCMGVENNRIRAHHLGLSGKLARRLPYRLMATYSKCYGVYGAPYAGEDAAQKPWKSVKETPLRQFSLGFNLELPFFRNTLLVLPGLYLDRGQVLPDAFGATLGIRYQIH